MAKNTTGGCLCGTVRFAYDGPIGTAAYCHCTDCRRCTGSAFNVSIAFEAAHFKIIAGAPKAYTKHADSGHELTRHFCADCGSPISTSSPKHPDRLYVKAGSLDDPTIIKPTYQSWTGSSVAWAAIDPELISYEKGRN